MLSISILALKFVLQVQTPFEFVELAGHYLMQYRGIMKFMLCSFSFSLMAKNGAVVLVELHWHWFVAMFPVAPVGQQKD